MLTRLEAQSHDGILTLVQVAALGISITTVDLDVEELSGIGAYCLAGF
jgi:hypothetical protein